jgi:selT/selW/selH-like putative selenoprotein
VSLAEKLQQAFGVETTLIMGGGGIFDVKLDGTLVYSKHDAGGFPDEDRLVEEIRARGL